MRFLHTSDWHLGVSIKRVNCGEEHALFLNWLVERVRDQAIDVLIVAGDIFDHAQPSNAARQAYFQFLRRCADIPTLKKVIIVAGNHDSPSGLDAPREILELFNVHVVGMLGREPEQRAECLVPIPGADGTIEAVVAAVPYMPEARLGVSLGEGNYSDLRAAYREAFQNLYARLADEAKARWPHAPLIATGHLTVYGDPGDAKPGDYQTGIHRTPSPDDLRILLHEFAELEESALEKSSSEKLNPDKSSPEKSTLENSSLEKDGGESAALSETSDAASAEPAQLDFEQNYFAAQKVADEASIDESSASEKKTQIESIGTIAALDPGIFDPRYCYIALGHIHRPMPVGGMRHVRYSGSPVAASLVEAATPRQVIEFELSPDATPQDLPIEVVRVPCWRDIFAIRGAPRDVLDRLSQIESDAPLAPVLMITVELGPEDVAGQARFQDFQAVLAEHFPPDKHPIIVDVREQKARREDLASSPLDKLGPPEYWSHMDVFRALYLRQYPESNGPSQKLIERFQEIEALLNTHD